MTLTSPEAYKTFASVDPTDTTFDAVLNLLIPMVDKAIRNEIERTVIEKTSGIVEYLDGNGLDVVLLRHTPVQAITEVRLDPAGFYGQGTGFGSTTVLAAGVDYAIVPDDPVNNWSLAGKLRRLNGVWPGRMERRPGQLSGVMRPGQGNIKVTYTAGYSAVADKVPADLQLAANLVVSQVRSAAELGFVPGSAHLSEASYSLLSGVQQAMQTGTVASILARYRRLAI